MMKMEPFSSIVLDITSEYQKIKKEDYLLTGNYRIIDQGQSFIGGYTNTESAITFSPIPRIVFGDHTKIIKFIDFPFAIGADGVKVLSVDTKKVFPKYLYYFLRTINLPDAGYSRHFKFLKGIKIPIFDDIEEQVRIAAILSKVDHLITQRIQSIALIDEFLRSVFLDMFADKDCTETRLGNLIEIQSGQVNPNESPYDNMFHVGGANIESNTGKLINLKIAKTENLISGKFLFTKDHILYSKIRPYLNKVATPDFTGICSADIYPIKPTNSSSLNKNYLRHVLMSKKFLAYALNNSDRANIPKINRDALYEFRIPIPSPNLQLKFSQIADKVDNLKVQFETSLADLESLYASLSQKAFKGELNLSKISIRKEDLERIKDLQEQEPETNNATQVEPLAGEKSRYPAAFDKFYNNWPDFLQKNFVDKSVTAEEAERVFYSTFSEYTDHQFDYEEFCELLTIELRKENSLLKQQFNPGTKQIEITLKK